MSYDPTIGRWTARDPIGFEGGDANLYRYVGNGPVDATDPTGTIGQLPDSLIRGRWADGGPGHAPDRGPDAPVAISPSPQAPSKSLPQPAPRDPGVVRVGAEEENDWIEGEPIRGGIGFDINDGFKPGVEGQIGREPGEGGERRERDRPILVISTPEGYKRWSNGAEQYPNGVIVGPDGATVWPEGVLQDKHGITWWPQKGIMRGPLGNSRFDLPVQDPPPFELYPGMRPPYPFPKHPLRRP